MKRSVRIDDTLCQDIDQIAQAENKATNQIIIEALKLYRDYYHLQNKATFINEQIIGITQAIADRAIQQINARGYKILSELVIQQSIIAQILASELEITDSDLAAYRLRAVEVLKHSQRLIRLDSEVDSNG